MPMPMPCTFAWLYLFNPGCPCLGSSTLDVLMSPDIGRNNLFLLITDCVHTVSFKAKVNVLEEFILKGNVC